MLRATIEHEPARGASLAQITLDLVELQSTSFHGIRFSASRRGRAYLGVGTAESTSSTGARVASVTAGGPAAAAGLKAGDVVTAIDGKRIIGSGDLVAAIPSDDPGDRITITIRRDSHTRPLTATLATQPEKQAG